MTASPWELAGMRRAIILSAYGLGTTSPNPPVGCVVFDSLGRLVGEGFHERKGEAHAEAKALEAAGSAASGGTAVVTLEPCNHFGRTPPCRKALIDAGIDRVVIAILDPTSRGDGGAAELRRAGVSVEIGVGEKEARLVLEPWLSALRAGRPTVTWAYQVSPQDDRSKSAHIVSPDRQLIADLRRQQDVVLFSNSQMEEGRPGEHGRNVFGLPSEPLPGDPQDALTSLAGAGVRTVLLVGGLDLAGPFLDGGLVDDIVANIQSPLLSASAIDSLGISSDNLAEFSIVKIVSARSGLHFTLSRQDSVGRVAPRS